MTAYDQCEGQLPCMYTRCYTPECFGQLANSQNLLKPLTRTSWNTYGCIDFQVSFLFNINGPRNMNIQFLLKLHVHQDISKKVWILLLVGHKLLNKKKALRKLRSIFFFIEIFQVKQHPCRNLTKRENLAFSYVSDQIAYTWFLAK